MILVIVYGTIYSEIRNFSNLPYMYWFESCEDWPQNTLADTYDNYDESRHVVASSGVPPHVASNAAIDDCGGDDTPSAVYDDFSN